MRRRAPGGARRPTPQPPAPTEPASRAGQPGDLEMVPFGRVLLRGGAQKPRATSPARPRRATLWLRLVSSLTRIEGRNQTSRTRKQTSDRRDGAQRPRSAQKPPGLRPGTRIRGHPDLRVAGEQQAVHPGHHRSPEIGHREPERHARNCRSAARNHPGSRLYVRSPGADRRRSRYGSHPRRSRAARGRRSPRGRRRAAHRGGRPVAH